MGTEFLRRIRIPPEGSNLHVPGQNEHHTSHWSQRHHRGRGKNNSTTSLTKPRYLSVLSVPSSIPIPNNTIVVVATPATTITIQNILYCCIVNILQLQYIFSHRPSLRPPPTTTLGARAARGARPLGKPVYPPPFFCWWWLAVLLGPPVRALFSLLCVVVVVGVRNPSRRHISRTTSRRT